MPCIKTASSSHEQCRQWQIFWYSLRMHGIFHFDDCTREFKVFQVLHCFRCLLPLLCVIIIISRPCPLTLALASSVRCLDFLCCVCSSRCGHAAFSICNIIFHPLYLTLLLVYFMLVGVCPFHCCRCPSPCRCHFSGVIPKYLLELCVPFILFNLTYSPFRSFHTHNEILSSLCSL